MPPRSGWATCKSQQAPPYSYAGGPPADPPPIVQTAADADDDSDDDGVIGVTPGDDGQMTDDRW